jgi:hypothetical protein
MTLLINFQIDLFFKRKFLIGLTSKFGNLVWPNASAALVLSVSPLFYMGFQSLNFVDILWPYTLDSFTVTSVTEAYVSQITT